MITWRDLLKFSETLDETEKKKEILISNPSRKLHYVSYTCDVQTETGAFSVGTKYIRAGAKPAARINSLYPTWEKMDVFIGELKEEDLDEPVLISSPKSELHEATLCKKSTKGTVFIQAGKKIYTYWSSHFEEHKICLCRGFKNIFEYKFLEFKSPVGLITKDKKWVLEKIWHEWESTTAGPYTELMKQKIKNHLQKATESEIQKLMEADGTTEEFEKKFEEPKEDEYSYWYELHRKSSPVSFSSKVHLYRGINCIEEECLLDMSTGIWTIEANWLPKKKVLPLPKTIFQISSGDVDGLFALIGTKNLFDWDITPKTSKKYWYIHICHPKAEEIYLCRGEKSPEEFIVMKKWSLNASMWYKLEDWSKWPTDSKRPFWGKVEKNLIEVSQEQMCEILFCVGKTVLVGTDKIKIEDMLSDKKLVPPEYKYWYLHIKNEDKKTEAIYVYRGLKKLETFKKISLLGDTWKLQNFNWTHVMPWGSKRPMDPSDVTKNVIEIDKIEAEKLLSIDSKPKTFDCNTHVTRYQVWNKKKDDLNGKGYKYQNAKGDDTKDDDKNYKYCCWAEQTTNGLMIDRRICLKRSFGDESSYKIMTINQRGVLSTWKCSGAWRDCMGFSLAHLVGKDVISKQISKYYANQILNLVGKTNLYCVRNVVNWEKDAEIIC